MSSFNVLHGGHFVLNPSGGGGGITTDTDEIIWNANEDLSLFTDAPVPGTFDITDMFDGTREAFVDKSITKIRLRQAVDGTSGTTEVEVYRNRGGVFTLIATLTLAQGGGDFNFVDVIPGSPALRQILTGDFLVVQFTQRQPDGRNVTVEADVISGAAGGSLTTSEFTCATHESTEFREIEVLLGSVVFTGGVVSSGFAPFFRAIAAYTPVGFIGDAFVRLYDLGPVAGPTQPAILRAELTIPFASAGNIIEESVQLIPVVAPAAFPSLQIFDTSRIYEARMIIDSETDGGFLKVDYAGIVVE